MGAGSGHEYGPIDQSSLGEYKPGEEIHLFTEQEAVEPEQLATADAIQTVASRSMINYLQLLQRDLETAIDLGETAQENLARARIDEMFPNHLDTDQPK